MTYSNVLTEFENISNDWKKSRTALEIGQAEIDSQFRHHFDNSTVGPNRAMRDKLHLLQVQEFDKRQKVDQFIIDNVQKTQSEE